MPSIVRHPNLHLVALTEAKSVVEELKAKRTKRRKGTRSASQGVRRGKRAR